jgi:hypothetical protein
MNVELFKSLLRPYWNTWSVNNLDDAADKIATAYDLSNIASSGPFFGAKLVKGDRQTLKTFLSAGLNVNFGLQVKPPDITPGFTLMATGFCMYWVGSIFTPLPAMPPMVAPTTGCQVLFPGIPVGFDMELKRTFDNTDVEQALTSFANSLVKHQLTIMGIYSGLVPSVPSPIPLVLPWTAMLSISGISIPSINLGGGEPDGEPDGGTGGGTGGGPTPPQTGKDQDGNDIETLNGLNDVIAKGESDATNQTQDKVNLIVDNLKRMINDALTSGKIIPRKANELLARANNIKSGLADPYFDASTGFDNSPDDKYIDYINLGSDGNLRPIDDIYVNQDQTTQEFFGNIIRQKLSQNRFKPNLIVDSRQRTKNRFESGYRNSYLGIVMELREQVIRRTDGTDEYQFYITLDMQNVGLFPFWDSTQAKFVDAPNMIGLPKSIFTFRDPIESPSSIWAGPPFNISSPKQRGLEIMRGPFEQILDEKIAELNQYIDRWFKGRLRKKLQTIDLYLTTEPRQDFNPFGNQVFTKMNRFVKLL